MPSVLTQTQLAAFHANGFVIVRAMFDPDGNRSAPPRHGAGQGSVGAHAGSAGCARRRHPHRAVEPRRRQRLWHGGALRPHGRYHGANPAEARSIISNPSSPPRNRSSAAPGNGTRTMAIGTITAACFRTSPVARSRSTAPRPSTAASTWSPGRICSAASTTCRFRAKARTSPTPPACTTSSRGSSRALRTRTRRRGVLPQQHAASLRREPLTAPPLDADLLL